MLAKWVWCLTARNLFLFLKSRCGTEDIIISLCLLTAISLPFLHLLPFLFYLFFFLRLWCWIDVAPRHLIKIYNSLGLPSHFLTLFPGSLWSPVPFAFKLEIPGWILARDGTRYYKKKKKNPIAARVQSPIMLITDTLPEIIKAPFRVGFILLLGKNSGNMWASFFEISLLSLM